MLFFVMYSLNFRKRNTYMYQEPTVSTIHVEFTFQMQFFNVSVISFQG